LTALDDFTFHAPSSRRLLRHVARHCNSTASPSPTPTVVAASTLEIASLSARCKCDFVLNLTLIADFRIARLAPLQYPNFHLLLRSYSNRQFNYLEVEVLDSNEEEVFIRAYWLVICSCRWGPNCLVVDGSINAPPVSHATMATHPDTSAVGSEDSSKICSA